MGGVTMDSLLHKIRVFCGFERCKMTLPIQGMNQSLFKRAQWEITLLGNILCNIKLAYAIPYTSGTTQKLKKTLKYWNIW